ncbi:MAG: hypothetical protein ACLP5H_08800 [Desulfomonilaceae bacterium]
MKLRKHICPVALLVVALAFLSVGSHAFGQGLQPPFMAPTPPSLCHGAFYFQAGVKYRNVDSFRFDVSGASNTIVVDLGTVPFGPTTAGNFGVGTGKPGFDGTSGTPTTNGFAWVYDNGLISGDVIPGPGTLISPGVLNPAIPNTCTPPAGTLCNADFLWTYSVIQPVIGRFVVAVSGACCTGNASESQGSFVIDDPTTQVNNLGSMAGTTQVTFQLAIPGSLTFTTNTAPDINRVVDSNVWGPSFEFGYQWSNFFDVFYGFSWFNVSNSIGLSNTIQGQAGHSVIQDTFPFVSDDTASWPVALGAFQSSDSFNIASSATHNYHMATNSSLQGILPNRQFSSVADASIPIENIQENIFNSAEFTPFENRFGARSWAPLYGLGRLGATLGTAVIPTHYKISGSASYIASGSSGAVAPGTVLAGQVSDHNDWTTLYGLFVGGDLSMGNTGYFLYASADYMWATNFHYDLGTVTTTFNPGGFTGGFSAGIQF